MADDHAHLDKVREQFTRQAEAYARMQQATDVVAFRKLVEFARAEPGDHALDVACGPGFLTMAFAERCASVVGFDATERFLALAQQEAERRGLGNVSFQQGDAEHLPFADAAFDLIVCRAAFHHMDRPERPLAEMKRVLKPAGRLLIVDMVAAEEAGKAARHNAIERLCDPSHTRALSESEFERLFAEAGIRIEARARSQLHHAVEGWLDHGGPPPAVAREITSLMERSMAHDEAGLAVRHENGKLCFSHTVVAFLGEHADRIPLHR